MNPDNQNCDQFEPMVSAMIDGELSNEEQLLLGNHLERCESCRELTRDFESVNVAVDSLAAATGSDHDSKLTETFVVTRQKQSLHNWLSVWRLVPLAGVAALLIGLFIVATQPAPQASAEQFSAEQFVKPLSDLNRINQQQQRDQELMLRTLGMDLRTLKLELKQLDNAGSDRDRIEEQIEAMLQRVQKFRADEA